LPVGPAVVFRLPLSPRGCG